MINDSQTHVLPHAAAAFAQVAALDASDDPAAWAAEIEARLGRVDDLAGDFFIAGQGLTENYTLDNEALIAEQYRGIRPAPANSNGSWKRMSL